MHAGLAPCSPRARLYMRDHPVKKLRGDMQRIMPLLSAYTAPCCSRVNAHTRDHYENISRRHAVPMPQLSPTALAGLAP